ncbi:MULTISPECIES: hypothetical protein [unclassified Spirosoma]|uniref:hypothetical protein n=1 Tax=unclassified Spirosoma TaxID=2621999 RepID=UPI0009619E53|nr:MULTISPECIES: hypothetical protein [unclassified Spirosoma]MBN8825074.1 hypothetical protein [Spirosoma sp.]OJW73361.1 MAG: hypothetical protein BGO59_07780 [Spirosoma sp. 48-14]
MRPWLILLLVSIYLSNQVEGGSTPIPILKQRFQKLAEKIRLQPPAPKEGDYEVRIWNNQSFQYGDAQTLYVLIKQGNHCDLVKYSLKSGKKRFKSARKIVPHKPLADSLWLQLTQKGILSLPNESDIDRQLHPAQGPAIERSGKMEPDGSFTVYGYSTKRSVWILDGEDYFFEVFYFNGYQIHEYDNPQSYLRAMPEVVELRKVVGILDFVASFFPPSK